VRVAQLRPRAPERKLLLMLPEQMFRVRKRACLLRERRVCPQPINLVPVPRMLPARLVILRAPERKHWVPQVSAGLKQRQTRPSALV
jgi:hypothetical protein